MYPGAPKVTSVASQPQQDSLTEPVRVWALEPGCESWLRSPVCYSRQVTSTFLAPVSSSVKWGKG